MNKLSKTLFIAGIAVSSSTFAIDLSNEANATPANDSGAIHSNPNASPTNLPIRQVMQEILADRNAVVSDVANAGYIPEEGTFSDSTELTNRLNNASDDILAKSALANNFSELKSVVLGGSLASAEGIDGTLALGNSTSDLVFVPVAPCRIVDTRYGTGAFAGKVSGGTTLNFSSDLSNHASQGGFAGNCGIASSAADPVAQAVTVTSAGATGNGHFQIFPYQLGSLPGASVLNYTGAPVANTTLAKQCQECGPDLSVYVSTTSHVIVDLTGYYVPAKLACPAGQALVNGKCFETGLRTAASYHPTVTTCATAGGRLPSVSELCQIYEAGMVGVYAGERTGHMAFDGNTTRVADTGGACGIYLTAFYHSSSLTYRCVHNPL